MRAVSAGALLVASRERAGEAGRQRGGAAGLAGGARLQETLANAFGF